MASLKRIFAGGSGRSGTTAVLTAIGEHPDVYSLPFEPRFLCDPDGLMDLASNLSDQYSLARARSALQRFERLMSVHLANPATIPYRQHNLPALLGREQYSAALEELLATLTAHEFPAYDYPAPLRSVPTSARLAQQLDGAVRKILRRPPSTVPPLEVAATVRQPRYWHDSAELHRVLARFVEQLFCPGMLAENAKTWCEKTPNNLLHPVFLNDLFPGAVFVHVYRDPRAIAYSLCQQPWAADDLAANCDYVEDFFTAWIDRRAEIRRHDITLIEFSLEDFASQSVETLAPLWRELGLPEHQSFHSVNKDYAYRWQQQMSAEQQRFVSKRLASTVEALGYAA